MKVSFVSSGLGAHLGGSAVSESSLVAELQKNCELRVFCPQKRLSQTFAQQKGLTHVVGYEPSQVLAAWFGLRSNGLQEAIKSSDVLHLNGHWRWESYFISRLAKRYGVPYVLHPRGMCLVGHRKVLLKKIFNLVFGNAIVRDASRVISLSDFERRQFSSYSLEKNRNVVIPNGIVGSGERMMSRASAPVDYPYFLYFGRIEARKNLLFLVDAFARYRAAGGCAHLVLVGPVERNYDQEVRRKSEELQVVSYVHVFPPAYGEEKWNYLKHALAVVYPAYEEAFGRVPFETVAAGSYPIIPDESGSAEYLREFLPSCVYAHADVNDLARKFSLFDKNQSERQDLARAQAWLNETLAWGPITQRVQGLYQEVMGA